MQLWQIIKVTEENTKYSLIISLTILRGNLNLLLK